MTDPRDLLDAARTDPAARLVLADRLRDDDGDTPAVSAVAGMCCEGCGCPDGVGFVARGGLTGRWYHLTDAQADNLRDENDLEGRAADGTPDRIAVEALRRRSRLELCHHLGRWWLVCEWCVRSLRARRANATRRANRQAREDAAPNLFTGVE